MSILISILLSLCLSIFAAAGDTPEILFLNSYHQGFKWSDDILTGFQDRLEEEFPEAILSIEYLDTKRYFDGDTDSEFFRTLVALLQIKYTETAFDAVVVSDNNGFDLLRRSGERIFGRTPVVFCGINGFESEMIAGLPHFTGITEINPIRETIELILQVQPDTERIIAVTDTTTSGVINHVLYRDVMIPEFRERVQIELLHNGEGLTVDELLDSVAGVESSDAIIFADFYRTRDGRDVDYREIIPLITETAACPVYYHSDIYLGLGIFGGAMAGGRQTGERAAELTTRILKGESPSRIPVIDEVLSVPMFDYRQLLRFSTPMRNLPENSVIVGYPGHSWREFSEFIWIATGLGTALLFLVAGLASMQIRTRAAVADLHERERDFRLALENLPVPLGIQNIHGKVVFVNSVFVKTYGYTVEDFDPMDDWFKLAYPDDAYRTDLRSRMKSLVDGLREYETVSFPEKITIRCKWGEEKTILFNLTRIRNRSITLMIDITTQEAHNLMLKDWNNRLESEVQDRTRELEKTNAALRGALQELEDTQSTLIEQEKMAAIGGLVAGVTHEISTPIGIGVTAASHLERRTEEVREELERNTLTLDGFRRFMNSITEGSAIILKNLRRVSDQIRGLKQVAVDQALGEDRRFLLRSYLEDVLLSLHPQFRKSPHSVTLECDPEIEVRSNPGLFAQILTNLVMNALIHGFGDADTPGRVSIEATTEETDLRLSLSDDGRGMEPEVVGKIFDPFFTTRREEGGSGLGLHIVYDAVVHKLGGAIRCSSSHNEGTRFDIAIPGIVINSKQVNPSG